MKEIQGRLSEHDLYIQLSDEARDWLAETGYDPDFGARPLRRALQKNLESPLSIKLLNGEFKAGDTVLVKTLEDGEGLSFSKVERISDSDLPLRPAEETVEAS
jgi:ATP-dependent Clp protease ATP-binding subunit ClpA